MILRFYSRLLTRLSMGWEVSRWDGISINYWRSLVAYASIALAPLYGNDLDRISAIFVYNKFCLIRRQKYFTKKKNKNNRIYAAELPIKGNCLWNFPISINTECILENQTWYLQWHRFRTNLTAKRVRLQCRNGQRHLAPEVPYFHHGW